MGDAKVLGPGSRFLGAAIRILDSMTELSGISDDVKGL